MIDPETLTDEERHYMDVVAHALPPREDWAEWVDVIFGGGDCQ